MVGVIIDREAPMNGVAKALSHWRRLTPLATWAAITLSGIDRGGIRAAVDAALERHGMPARQLILLGEGVAARCTLELVLQGVLACAGMLAIGCPCHAPSFRITPTAAAVRLVVYPRSHEGTPDDLIDALRAADIDERVIRLNPGRDDSLIAASAAETFVLELVATVGHQARHGARTYEKQKT